MHGRYALLAVTALALVAGCNRGATNNSANKAASTNSANSTAAAPAPVPATAGGAPVDAALLTAHPWGPAGDCTKATTFNADGTLLDKDGPGTWTLEGNTLTVTQKGVPQPATVSRSGDNMIAANPANPAQTMTVMPCPATAGGAADAEEGAGGEGTE